MKVLILLSVIAAWSVLNPISQAHAEDGNACDILAAKLPQDVLIQGSNFSIFRKYQSLISDDKYMDYSRAASTKLDLGISVPDYVDGTLGTKSDSTSWGRNWEKFRSMQENDFLQNGSAQSETRTTNERVIRDIATCTESNAQGLHNALYVTEDKSSFTIKIRYNGGGGSSKWAIQQLLLSPDGVATCKSIGTLPRTIEVASVSIQCSKDADRSVQINVNTSQGPIGPYEIQGVQSDIQNLQQQVDDLTRTINSQLAELEGRVNTVAARDPFQNRNCQDITTMAWGGWLVCPAGQYVAGAMRWKSEQQLTYIRCCPAS